jgi:hypothetical protein
MAVADKGGTDYPARNVFSTSAAGAVRSQGFQP